MLAPEYISIRLSFLQSAGFTSSCSQFPPFVIYLGTFTLKQSAYQLNDHNLNKKIFKSFLELCLLNCDMLRNLTENLVACEIIDKHTF